jgi:hypothetical protein
MREITVLPKVKQCIRGEGTFNIKVLRVSETQSEAACSILSRSIGEEVVKSETPNIYIQQQEVWGEEGYSLEITAEALTIGYGTVKGLFYAGITLKYLLKQYDRLLPCMHIEDTPDLPVRGVLYDISRNKVPKLETLFKRVDLLADLKYNQLQLYVEGLSFEYEHYKEYLKQDSYMTKQEIKELQAYCKERFIELVPNQNTLGHMEGWLELEDFKHLRENPDGTMAFGTWQLPSTLNPTHPESMQFIENITEDMLKHFESEYYNVNLDETFGLGLGASEFLVEKIGKEGIYIEWVKKMYDLAQKNNRKMMMWGDIILSYKEKLSELPKDIILMDWGYEDHYPFNQDCKKLKESGLTFYVCPGTSSWLSITGRTENMLGNVDKAVSCAHEYGAKGLIMTDWGDRGHWQTGVISYPGFVYGASKAWNKKEVTEKELADHLSLYVFEDRALVMGEVSLQAGRCNQFEDLRLLNGNMSYHHFEIGLCTKKELDDYLQKAKEWMVPYAESFLEDGGAELLGQLQVKKAFDYEGLVTYITNLKQALLKAELQCEGQEAIKKEYIQAFDLTLISADIRQYIEKGETFSRTQKISYLKALGQKLEEHMKLYKENWLRDNKISYLEKSISLFIRLEGQIREALETLTRGA